MFRNKHIVRRGAPHKETILFLGLAVILAFFLLLLVVHISSIDQPQSCIQKETCFLDICHVRNESSNSFCYVSSQCQNLPRIVELFDCECLEQIIADQPGCSSYYTVPPVKNIYRNVWAMLFLISFGLAAILSVIVSICRCLCTREQHSQEEAPPDHS
ncbi:uncharacterized protein [Lepeophtheirus salmonis]|uniref:uncharacterized protein n=1 Tax=Lepeophtheirus salmonis TaxID=72036 RepID=UPI001AE46820|nr:uncharacterized protein LOC121117651 [Lepeophtheirus salmonis]